MTMTMATEPVVPSGPELRRLREELKLSRQKLIRELGEPWTEGRLNNYEAEKRGLRPAERAALATWCLHYANGTRGGLQGTPPMSLMNMHEDDDIRLPLEEEVHVLSEEEPITPTATVNRARLIAVEAHFRSVQEQLTLNRVTAPINWPITEPLHPDLDEASIALVEEWCSNVEAWLALLHEQGQVLAPSAAAMPAAVVATPAVEPSPLGALTGVAALYVNGQRVVTNSELQTFKHCRRRWWLSFYRGLRLKREVLTGLAPLGTRIHLALAGWYVPEGETPVDPRETLERTITEDETRLLTQGAELPGEQVANQLAEFAKEADLARAMVEGYVDWLAETGADSQFRVLAPEQVLTAVMEMSDDLTIRLQGRLDVRVQRDHDLVKLFLDHKSVGDFQQITKIGRLDEQMKTYHLLEEANDGPENRTEGAIYNMLRRVKRSSRANPPFYDRHEVRHSTLTIHNFHERLRGETLTVHHTEQLLNEGVDHQLAVYPSPGRDCTWKCEFTTLCSMLDDGSRAEDFIAEHYEAVDPLERYADERDA